MPMEIALQAGSLLEVETPLLVVNLFEGVGEPGGATGAVDQALGGLLRRLIEQREIRGELGQVVVVHNPGGASASSGQAVAAERVAVVGLGKRDEFGLEAVRVASAAAVRKARELRIAELASVAHGAGTGGLEFGEALRAVAEAGLLANYDYRRYKTQGESPTEVRRLTIVERDPERLEHARPAVLLAGQGPGGRTACRDPAARPS